MPQLMPGKQATRYLYIFLFVPFPKNYVLPAEARRRHGKNKAAELNQKKSFHLSNPFSSPDGQRYCQYGPHQCNAPFYNHNNMVCSKITNANRIFYPMEQ